MIVEFKIQDSPINIMLNEVSKDSWWRIKSSGTSLTQVAEELKKIEAQWLLLDFCVY